MKYTTVFLDFDDTLIDTQGFSKKCLKTIYHKHHIDQYFPTYEQFIDVYSFHIYDLWESYALEKIDKKTLLHDRFIRPFSTFPDVDQSWIDSMNKDFMKMVVKIDAAIEGAEDLLNYLKPKYKIVMLSNGFSELQYDKMANTGLSDYFDLVILSDQVGVNKPHPDIFTYALNKAGSTIENSIMIGDNLLADIQGAMNSKIDQIWYNPHREKTDIKPTYTVSKLKEILDII